VHTGYLTFSLKKKLIQQNDFLRFGGSFVKHWEVGNMLIKRTTVSERNRKTWTSPFIAGTFLRNMR